MKFYIILIYSFLLAGCSGSQYVASTPYVPLPKKRGQLDINIYLSSIQAGYVFTNHFMCFVTGYRRFNDEGGGNGNPFKKDNTERYRENNASEINIGIAGFKKKERISYALLVGGGLGRMDYLNKRDYYHYHFDMKAYTKNLYLQPTAGIVLKHNFELAVFTKLNFFQYYNISTYNSLGVYLAPEVQDEFFIGKKQAEVLILNPGVSFKAGWKFMKFHVQVSPTINLLNTVIRHQSIALNAGLSFSFDLLDQPN